MTKEDVDLLTQHIKARMIREMKANPDKVFVFDAGFNGPYDLVQDGKVLKTYEKVSSAERTARHLNRQTKLGLR